MTFGDTADIAYAEKLWRVLEKRRLVGADEKPLKPFFGGAKPHGVILEIDSGLVTVEDHEGFVVVKKNYNGPGVSVQTVEQNRKKFLSSITVMYRREAGYDADNQNWFWVKYKPDGSLFSKRLDGDLYPMAGKIVKGKTREENAGCIYCHSSAGGSDYIFYPEIVSPAER